MPDASRFWVSAVHVSPGLSGVDRINEILFGLIMVLTFTCSISAATAGHEELATVLWSALGCNVAWGLVDAIMYLFSVLLERGEMFGNVRTVRQASTEEAVAAAVRDALPPVVAKILKEDQILQLGRDIQNLPEPPQKVSLTLRDIVQALKIFVLVFLSTFPVTLPFLLVSRITLAMRISNGVALVLLFATGVFLARQTGRAPVVTGLIFACIGAVLVSVTMALGG